MKLPPRKKFLGVRWRGAFGPDVWMSPKARIHGLLNRGGTVQWRFPLSNQGIWISREFIKNLDENGFSKEP
jgi:hypothetical protein